MNYLWKIVRNIMGVVGFVLVLGGVSTSDYYVIELGQPEPSSVGRMIFIGLMLMVPTAIHIIRNAIRENNYEKI